MKKKVLLVVLIIIIIVPLFIVIYPVMQNNNYEKNMLGDIYNNTNIKDITYLNKDNNYYVLKTKEKVLVLDLNYEEVLSIDANNIEESSLELVYRRNNLYYEEKVKDGSKITYNFYNVKTNELEYSTPLGGV